MQDTFKFSFAAAAAALPVGSAAPDFVTTGAIAGKPFQGHRVASVAAS